MKIDRVKTLRQAINSASGELETLIENETAFRSKQDEITKLRGELERAMIVEQNNAGNTGIAPGTDIAGVQYGVGRDAASVGNNLRSMARAKPDFSIDDVRSAMGFELDEQKSFRSFGEQLQAVAGYYRDGGTKTDARLVRAPTGAGEVDPTGGGFLVQTDFANMVWTRAYTMGKILGAVNKFPISTGANGIKIPGIDETSRATGSRYGGVQSFWLAEGDTITGSKPKFRWIEFDLKKLGSVMFATDELLADTSLLGQIAMTAFSEELTFMTEDGIWEGDGAGKPLGVLNAPCTVQVPKVVGQAPGTIVKENIDAMYAQMWARSRPNAKWYINQLALPQLYNLSQTTGTSGMPMFIPPGGMGNNPKPMVYGIPVEEIEYASAPGTPGDIMLADFSQYGVADKGGMQAATSMHVKFLTDEMTFRFVYRVDGKPMWNKPLTPFKGSSNLSPFVVIAQR